jgi:hypothetical protein
MKKDKYYSEDELVQMYQANEINLVTFIDLHSKEWQNEYLEFCSDRNMDINENSAEAFLDWKAELLEQAIENGNA